MSLKDKRIGFGLTGSHCTYDVVFPQLQQLIDLGADVIPIVSYTVKNVDSKFGQAEDHIAKIESITNKKVISTMQEAEPLEIGRASCRERVENKKREIYRKGQQ